MLEDGRVWGGTHDMGFLCSFSCYQTRSWERCFFALTWYRGFWHFFFFFWIVILSHCFLHWLICYLTHQLFLVSLSARKDGNSLHIQMILCTAGARLVWSSSDDIRQALLRNTIETQGIVVLFVCGLFCLFGLVSLWWPMAFVRIVIWLLFLETNLLRLFVKNAIVFQKMFKSMERSSLYIKFWSISHCHEVGALGGCRIMVVFGLFFPPSLFSGKEFKILIHWALFIDMEK